MNKDSIKMLIAEYQRDASKDELVDRKYSIEDGLNYVFVGLRRAGKSCLMFRQIQQLLATGHSRDEILYFNFEDDRLTELDAPLLDSIKVCYEEMFDCRPIFFLDEIQIVSGWEKFARRLADQGYRVFITGSNAKMLSSEIATTLGGRYMIQQVWPFSFEEFLTASNIPISDSNAIYTHRNSIIKTFETYFQFGGLPEVARITGKRQWLGNLYQKLFFGDLIARHQIRNDFSLRVLIRKLAESIRQPSSFNRLANVTSAAGKKISTDTVIDYLSFLKESWLIFFVENFYAKLADKTRNQKYYFTDNGLLNLFLMDPKSSLLENLVAIQLKRLHGDEVYFYHNGIEVDFYLPITQTAIQVCYTLEDTQTRKRECGALLHLADRLPVEKMLIISKDEEEIIQLEDRTIEVTPLWKWLLGTVG
ncbi:MAG: ATP-binding protein [Acidobacteriota bacterium]|jgi:predicted AAA+ superfamily ATPase|nr:ATP-binding protein [Acidobacteriota bacterium]